ncbi:MAG: hypothetical protein LDL50_03230 [Chloroflexi bacterium]|nr:hypothetical protein [Chloroflexota bacterium]MCA2001196.1 hypothetical protein [Chloroflexota bacterium]
MNGPAQAQSQLVLNQAYAKLAWDERNKSLGKFLPARGGIITDPELTRCADELYILEVP